MFSKKIVQALRQRWLNLFQKKSQRCGTRWVISKLIILIQEIATNKGWKEELKKFTDPFCITGAGAEQQFRQNRRTDMLGDHQWISKIKRGNVDRSAEEPQG